tara:strand:- start:426 stop:827 length:402 start_codon:yes stop_codon:yes gene_type:complete
MYSIRVDITKRIKMINGIKPELSAQTKYDNKDDYSTALTKMIHRIDEQYGKYYEKTLPNSTYTPITINKGRRFDKLVQGGSVYCFVEKSTGDVYKSQTWKQPYTKGNNCVRGSIYDTSSYWDKELRYGSWLYA